MSKFQLHDCFALDDAAKVRFTSDGYMVAMPRVARTGIQLYRGSELGLTGDDGKKVIRVYRPEDAVFDSTSMATFAHKPVTDDHPPVAVNAGNWGKYGKGQLGDEVARDGEAIRVPMVLMDGGLITKFKNGKAELSVGYTCDIVWTAGTTADGQSFDASQKNIGVNHVAVVDAARAGKEFRIGDGSGEARVDFGAYAAALTAIIKGNVDKASALAGANGHLAKDSKGNCYPIMKDGSVFLSSLRACKTDAIAKGDGDVLAAVDNLLSAAEGTSPAPAMTDGPMPEKGKTMKTMQLDGITIEVGDGNASEVIGKHIKTLGDSVADVTARLTAALATHATVLTTKDGEIAKLTTDLSAAVAKTATLEQQLKDGAMTPAKLDALVADRAVVALKAKAVMGDKAATLVVDNKSDAEIRRQVVDAKLGEAAKGWTDDQVKISFDTLTAGIDVAKITAAGGNLNADAHRPGGFRDQAATFSHAPMDVDAGEKAAQARDKRLTEAWKTPPASA